MAGVTVGAGTASRATQPLRGQKTRPGPPPAEGGRAGPVVWAAQRPAPDGVRAARRRMRGQKGQLPWSCVGTVPKGLRRWAGRARRIRQHSNSVRAARRIGAGEGGPG